MRKIVAKNLQFAMVTLGACMAGCAVAEQGDQLSEEAVQAEKIGDFHTTYVSVNYPVTKLVIDVRDASQSNTAVVQLFHLLEPDSEHNNQRWKIRREGTAASGPYYSLKNQHSGLCLDLPVDFTKTLQVRQSSCTPGAPSQMWISIPDPANNWRMLRNLADNRCLDARGGVPDAFKDLTVLQVWDCTGAANQRWNVL